MLSKKYRLHGKSVSFLLWKKKQFHGCYFSFLYFEYRGMQNRFSFHVSKKIHKSAVKRIFLKRLVLSSLFDLFPMDEKLSGKHYQVFIRINIRFLNEWKSVVEKSIKKDISSVVMRWFAKDIESFKGFLSSL